MTNTMPATACLNPTGGRNNIGLAVATMLNASGACRVFQDAGQQGFSIPEQQTKDDWACWEEMINHPLVVAEVEFAYMVAPGFHLVQDKYSAQGKDQIRIFENANWESDVITRELVNLEK